MEAPNDVNWQKTIDDLDKFERRIRLAVFHHGKDPDESNQTVDERLPTIPSTSNWRPPKFSFPEVELLLNSVKKDILEPKNLRKAKDNLTKEERLALSKLKSSDNVCRIQDKGPRFVIVSKNEYQDKIFEQVNHNLHCDKLNYDPTMEHFEKVKNWSRDWLGKGQISQEITTWVAIWNQNRGWRLAMLKLVRKAILSALFCLVAERQSKDFLPLLNFISSLLLKIYHHLLKILLILLTRSKHSILRKAPPHDQR